MECLSPARGTCNGGFEDPRNMISEPVNFGKSEEQEQCPKSQHKGGKHLSVGCPIFEIWIGIKWVFPPHTSKGPASFAVYGTGKHSLSIA